MSCSRNLLTSINFARPSIVSPPDRSISAVGASRGLLSGKVLFGGEAFGFFSGGATAHCSSGNSQLQPHEGFDACALGYSAASLAAYDAGFFLIPFSNS